MDMSEDEKVKARKPSDFYDNEYLQELQGFVRGLWPEGIPST